MTTFVTKNTIVEDAINVVVFVDFTLDDVVYEEALRFPLTSSVVEILTKIQERATFYDERKIRMAAMAEELRREIMQEQNLQE